MNEPMECTLEERLESAKNFIDIALLISEKKCLYLLPTALEGLFYLSQLMLDEYCVEDK